MQKITLISTILNNNRNKAKLINVQNGDRVWIGANAPTDPLIKFWLYDTTQERETTIHISNEPPTDDTKLWIDIGGNI